VAWAHYKNGAYVLRACDAASDANDGCVDAHVHGACEPYALRQH